MSEVVKNILKQAYRSVESVWIANKHWTSDRKIVVIESDDWGMIRMRSKQSYEELINKGYPLNSCAYSSNDSLESNDDMERLFEVLTKFKDSQGNHPVITANNIVANPDFKRIEDGAFKQYFYEPFTKTLERYPNRENVMSYYKQGIELGIFIPQFHGREHLNVHNWMKALQNKDKRILDAFRHSMYTLPHEENMLSNRLSFLDAFGNTDATITDYYRSIIKEGLLLFQDIHGYQATSFIAPCYTWSSKLESYLSETSIKYIQGNTVQVEPNASIRKGYNKKLHYIGEMNHSDLMYTTRNCTFEPFENPSRDTTNSCLHEITQAFNHGFPAIISSHRVNYMGSISEKNRDNGLIQLSALLHGIIKLWPDVEFVSSSALGQLIESSRN